jgi:hypothetical protein
MFSAHLTGLVLACCASFCLTQAHAGREQLHDNDAEAWARRDYFYAGGQYVQTTLVCLVLWNEVTFNALD